MHAETNSRRSSALLCWSAVGAGFLLAAAAGVHWLGLSAVTSSPPTLRNLQSDTPAIVEPSPPETKAVPRFDPDQALALALRETDPSARTNAVAATLRIWARQDPAGAAAWIQAHATLVNLTEVMMEIIASMAGPPQDAVSWAGRLAPTNPGAARDCGYAVIFGLDRRGDFSVSAGYASSAPTEVRRDLLIAAYHDWGRHQPEIALIAAARIDDPTTRQTALQAALSGWARTDPEGLAGTALDFPEGAEKMAALTKALRAWLVKDPWKAGDWILAHHVALPAAEAAMRDD
jgi:hypothetical protein